MVAGARTAIADEQTLAALRSGDERTFRELFARSYPMMKRVARAYVDSDAVAVSEAFHFALAEMISRVPAGSSLGIRA